MAITSFSQKALLSPLYQNYLNPPKCALQIIENPNDSLLETLQGLEFIAGKLRPDPLHKTLGPPVRAIARMVYMVGVAILIAPAGVAWHSVNALGYLAIDRTQARAHAYCAYTDLFVIGQTAFVCVFSSTFTAFSVLVTYLILLDNKHSTLEKLIFVVVGMIPFGLAIFMSVGLGGYDQNEFVQTTVGHNENRVAMYISLQLHSELGLSGPNGELLPFSAKDEVYYRKSDQEFVDKNNQKSKLWPLLFPLMAKAEKELAEHAGEATRYVTDKSQCSYDKFFDAKEKFDGSRLIHIFEQIADSSDNKETLLNFVAKMRRSQHMIESLKNILNVAGTMAAKKRGINLSYEHAPMYSNKIENEQIFNDAANNTQWLTILKKTEAGTLDQNPRKNAIFYGYSKYDQLKTQVQYARWCVLNKQEPPNAYELMGLEKDYTATQLKEAYLKYAAVVHPDKNPQDLEVTNQLFQCLNQINGLLKEKLKKRL